MHNYTNIIETIKQNKIQAVYFIPPMHANFTCDLYNKYEKEYFNLKYELVEKVDEILDFSILNVYNVQKLSNTNQYYYDKVHPKQEYGKIVKKVLQGNRKENKNLYTILTKENINLEIKKQQMALEQFCN